MLLKNVDILLLCKSAYVKLSCTVKKSFNFTLADHLLDVIFIHIKRNNASLVTGITNGSI